MKSIKFQNKIKELCKRYDQEEEQKEIEKQIFDNFYKQAGAAKNRDYYKLSKILEENNQPILAVKANNVHYAIEANDLIKQSSPEKEYQERKNKLKKKLDNHITKDNFLHYIKTEEMLKYHEKNHELIYKKLQQKNWLKKQRLYSELIDKIIKECNHTSKASIIIISNGNEEYILESLVETNKQARENDCQIILVSNNKENQTELILSLTDTFIQLNKNTGAYLARNIGSLFANSDVLIFIEDDGVPAASCIAEHIRAHSNNKIMTVRGCYLSKSNGVMPEHYWLGMHPLNSAPNLEGNCSIKSNIFYTIGGWGDYILFGHGGYDLCYRMLETHTNIEQHKYIPSAILYHNWTKPDEQMIQKQLKQHASWHILRQRHKYLYKLKKDFNNKQV